MGSVIDSGELRVNARHVKNVSRRKSDVLDRQWLQQLHSYGRVHGAFRPADGVVALRDRRFKASEADIARALHGHWRREHLFTLKQALAAFDFCGQQLAELHARLEAQTQGVKLNEDESDRGKKRSTARNAPKFDLRTRLFQMCGVDLTRIDGLDVTTALVVVSETGGDLSRFPSAKHFASWLGLSPGTRISGGKPLSGWTLPNADRAALALRLAAAAMGAYHRRMCARMDKAKAVTAAAHRLARLIYAMLTQGKEYTGQGQDDFEERYRQRVAASFSRRAQQLGMKLVPETSTASSSLRPSRYRQ